MTNEELLKLQTLNNKIYLRQNPLKVHDEQWRVRAFYGIRSQREIVSYLGVARLTVYVGEQCFRIRTLSWVGTDPAYRNQGFSSDLIKTAVNWIEKQENFDLWLFTADSGLVQFYQQNVGVTPYVNIKLVGNDNDPDSFSSDKLQVVVLARALNETSKEVLKTADVFDLKFEKHQFI